MNSLSKIQGSRMLHISKEDEIFGQVTSFALVYCAVIMCCVSSCACFFRVNPLRTIPFNRMNGKVCSGKVERKHNIS